MTGENKARVGMMGSMNMLSEEHHSLIEGPDKYKPLRLIQLFDMSSVMALAGMIHAPLIHGDTLVMTFFGFMHPFLPIRQSGTRSSAILFSMIQTAKENGLDPYRYLTWVLKKALYRKMSDLSDVDTLLPTNAPGECRIGNVPV